MMETNTPAKKKRKVEENKSPLAPGFHLDSGYGEWVEDRDVNILAMFQPSSYFTNNLESYGKFICRITPTKHGCNICVDTYSSYNDATSNIIAKHITKYHPEFVPYDHMPQEYINAVTMRWKDEIAIAEKKPGSFTKGASTDASTEKPVAKSRNSKKDQYQMDIKASFSQVPRKYPLESHQRMVAEAVALGNDHIDYLGNMVHKHLGNRGELPNSGRGFGRGAIRRAVKKFMPKILQELAIYLKL